MALWSNPREASGKKRVWSAKKRRPSCEECVADVADGALDSAFLVAARHGDRSELEAVVRGELKKPRIKTERLSNRLSL